MEKVFINKLKPFLDAVAGDMELYAPKKFGEHYGFSRYDASSDVEPEFNNIRVCSPAKEFLFPMRELAAVFPEPASPEEVKPFAVFGLKDCDLRAIEILDHVFKEEDFIDPLYISRREKMFVITADCYEPGQTCCCTLFDGKPYSEKGFDLNVSKVKDGFIIEAGSEKGQEFISKHKDIFGEVGEDAVLERDAARADTEKQLDEINANYELDRSAKEGVENTQDSEVYDGEAKDCVECQACTRVCPTCHCFFLYDTKQKDYFGKMKMSDSCMRCNYARVAGDENPRKILGDRSKHRMMHKFVYFLERYGINMCVGCGRCMDGCAGETDVRDVLKKLNEELKTKQTEAKK